MADERPFHWAADGLDADSQCTRCLGSWPEEEIEAITGVDGVLYYCCPACAEELRRDFE